ncbi:MAG: antitoxin [Jiangellales bacterium]
MGWKDTLAGAADAVSQAVSQNRATIEQGIDKAAEIASSSTGGKYDETIRKGTQHARSGLDKVASATDEPGEAPPADSGRPT